MADDDIAVRISKEYYRKVSDLADRNLRTIKTTIEICIDHAVKHGNAINNIKEMAIRRKCGCNEMKNTLEKHGVINKEK